MTNGLAAEFEFSTAEFEFSRTRFMVEEDGTVCVHEAIPGSGGMHHPRRYEWRAMTNAELLKFPATCDLWVQLRQRGVRRPSPSGPRGPETRTEADRGTRVRLSDEATSDADKLARRWGVSRPEAVARALREIAHR